MGEAGGSGGRGRVGTRWGWGSDGGLEEEGGEWMVMMV